MAEQESLEFGKADFVLLDAVTMPEFMANLRLRSACAFCCASRCVPGARGTSLLLERQLILSIDANRNESSVTPMFSGLASSQCKERSGAGCTVNGISYFVKLATCTKLIPRGTTASKNFTCPLNKLIFNFFWLMG